MKRVTSERYRKDTYGSQEHEVWLGIRCDEISRVVGAADYKTYNAMGLVDDEIMDMLKSDDINRPFKDIRYLAEISDMDKQDILEWWSNQPFDLEIDEHLGNCVFCIKKSIGKIALAQRDEPELAVMWEGALSLANLREDLQQKNPAAVITHKHDIIYRGKNSFDTIRQKYASHTRDEIRTTLRSMKQYDTGACTESCEAFNTSD